MSANVTTTTLKSTTSTKTTTSTTSTSTTTTSTTTSSTTTTVPIPILNLQMTLGLNFTQTLNNQSSTDYINLLEIIEIDFLNLTQLVDSINFGHLESILVNSISDSGLSSDGILVHASLIFKALTPINPAIVQSALIDVLNDSFYYQYDLNNLLNINSSSIQVSYLSKNL